MLPNTRMLSLMKNDEIECFENFIERDMLLVKGFIWYRVLRATSAFIWLSSPGQIEFMGPDVLYTAID
jgi:hypothetical protein